jgi:multidrug efflux system membrane fusion protein
MAMLLTPAILAHGDDGRIGVRIVDDRNIVRFAPVELITQGPEGAWVRGLADQARVISVGHEYVVAGQEVQPVFENAETDGR